MVLRDGLTLWGAAHCKPAGTPGFLESFNLDRGGVNLCLFHGSESNFLAYEREGKSPHAPFSSEQIESAGFNHAFVGHYHSPHDGQWHTYPGNPEFLTFGESGPRGAVIVNVSEDGEIMRTRRRVGEIVVHDLVVDLTGCKSRQDALDQFEQMLSGLVGIARVTVTGEVAAKMDIQPDDFKSIPSNLEGVIIRVKDLMPGYDIEAISKEPTVRGQFVRDVLASDLNLETQNRVLLTGLRALDGRDDLEVLSIAL
jgi:DNA repair exonuclease SbcCD nuclease subunit